MIVSKGIASCYIIMIIMLLSHPPMIQSCGEECHKPHPGKGHHHHHPPPHHGGGHHHGPPKVSPPIIMPPYPPVIVPPPVILPPPVVPPPTIILPPPSVPCPPPPPKGGGGGGRGPPPPKHRPPPAPTPEKPKTCPIDALKLGLCLDVLGGLVHIGIGNPVENVCCPVIQGLLELEAAICLCTAIRLKLLNLNIFLPIALQVLANCGKPPPPGFVCPIIT